jgi:hypothetical protein
MIKRDLYHPYYPDRTIYHLSPSVQTGPYPTHPPYWRVGHPNVRTHIQFSMPTLILSGPFPQQWQHHHHHHHRERKPTVSVATGVIRYFWDWSVIHTLLGGPMHHLFDIGQVLRQVGGYRGNRYRVAQAIDIDGLMIINVRQQFIQPDWWW